MAQATEADVRQPPRASHRPRGGSGRPTNPLPATPPPPASPPRCSFDRVLVDAPCSGVGAWRRNPDARWLRRTRPIEELLPVQADVLQRAARLVRPGGTLVYATCSLLPEENEAQVEAFLASADGAEFELAPPEHFGAPFDDGYLRLSPARHGCDGFFGAALVRSEGGWTRRGRRTAGASC